LRISLPQPGELVADRYEILEEVGVGGFGAVYRSHQRGIGKEVALKVLLPQAAAVEGSSQRFRREAMLAKELNHPNTITLFDYGETEDGLTYIAMEFLYGVELRKELADNGVMSEERVGHVTQQCLKSLAEAHANGVVHRDLKPANIMLVEVFGEKDFVKVLDFGIARAFEDHAEDFKTKTGTVIGTPQYMAPEQLKGEDVGPAADLYSLGLMMCEMMTCSVVYGQDNSNLVIVAQLSDPSCPIPHIVLSSGLGHVIYTATQKDPTKRFQSAPEMLEALKTPRPADISLGGDGVQMAIPGQVIGAQVDNTSDIVMEVKRSGRKKLIGFLLALILIAAGSVAYIIWDNNRSESYPASESNQGMAANRSDEAFGSVQDNGDGTAGVNPENEQALHHGIMRAQVMANGVTLSFQLWAPTATSDGTSATGEGSAILLFVTSIPSGAQVYRGVTDLGPTPLARSVSAGSGPETLRLMLSGYNTFTVEKDLSVDTIVDNIELERVREERTADSRGRRDSQEGASSTENRTTPSTIVPEASRREIRLIDEPGITPTPDPVEEEQTARSRGRLIDEHSPSPSNDDDDDDDSSSDDDSDDNAPERGLF
jgi:serine/threonine protein kinase